jgi:transaldolase/glucose-6-phosphate isomerase
LNNEKSLKKYLESHLAHLQEDDYFALLAYVEMNRETKNFYSVSRKGSGIEISRHLSRLRTAFSAFLPDKPTKAARRTACFCKSHPMTLKISKFLNKNSRSAWFKAAQARGDFQVLLDRDRRAFACAFGHGCEKRFGKTFSIDLIKRQTEKA